MSNFIRHGQDLYCESVPLQHIAEKWGTPCYVYSRASIEHNIDRLEKSLAGHPHHIQYAMKANSAAGILQLINHRGLGVDTVSGGEIARALRAGIPAQKIVFSGVGKTVREIRYALKKGIGCFNIESEAEFDRLAELAKEMKVVAPFSIRCNPNVDAKTHPYISTGLKKNKFGVPLEKAEYLYLKSQDIPNLQPIGIDAHIGSQILIPSPHIEAAQKLLTLVEKLAIDGIKLQHLDIGGGYGIAYGEQDHQPDLESFFQPIIAELKKRHLDDLSLMIEPGRAIVGEAGVLLTHVEYLKHNGAKRFCVTDAGMNDLIRPALYDAWMRIEPVHLHPGDGDDVTPFDVVGPVCESSDFLGLDRHFPVKAGDILAVFDAGAYGSSMASRYNSRPLPAEILVDGQTIHVLRQTEELDDIVSGDCLIDIAPRLDLPTE